MELTKKKLESSEALCLSLQHARLQHGFSIASIAEKLKMNKEHIEIIESGEFDRLPFALIYQKKLIGNYAEVLGLEKQTMMKQFEIERKSETITAALSPISKKRHSDWWYNLPFLFRISGISMSAILLLGYLGFQVKQIVNPPELSLIAPLDGAITKDQAVEVKGKTEKEVKVMINGKEVKHDEQGVFNEPITLTQGVNTIVISATTKHGKTTTLTRYVVSQKDSQFSLGESIQNRN